MGKRMRDWLTCGMMIFGLSVVPLTPAYAAVQEIYQQKADSIELNTPVCDAVEPAEGQVALTFDQLQLVLDTVQDSNNDGVLGVCLKSGTIVTTDGLNPLTISRDSIHLRGLTRDGGLKPLFSFSWAGIKVTARKIKFSNLAFRGSSPVPSAIQVFKSGSTAEVVLLEDLDFDMTDSALGVALLVNQAEIGVIRNSTFKGGFGGIMLGLSSLDLGSNLSFVMSGIYGLGLASSSVGSLRDIEISEGYQGIAAQNSKIASVSGLRGVNLIDGLFSLSSHIGLIDQVTMDFPAITAILGIQHAIKLTGSLEVPTEVDSIRNVKVTLSDRGDAIYLDHAVVNNIEYVDTRDDCAYSVCPFNSGIYISSSKVGVVNSVNLRHATYPIYFLPTATPPPLVNLIVGSFFYSNDPSSLNYSPDLVKRIVDLEKLQLPN